MRGMDQNHLNGHEGRRTQQNIQGMDLEPQLQARFFVDIIVGIATAATVSECRGCGRAHGRVIGGRG